ncbi:MAG: mprF [Gemmatimonadetes bacterium]|nr:mprF [Gemmatimonadota bacterium]
MRALTPWLSIVLFAVAIWALRRELHELSLDDVIRSVQSYDATHLLLALLCTTGSFLALGAMELLALRYVGRSRAIPRSTALTTGFVAHAFSQSVGLALLTGAAVRLRVYGRRAIDAVTVARMSGFATLTVTLGLLATGAAALLASSAPLRIGPAVIPMKPLGALLALVVLGYLMWSAAGRERCAGRLRRFERPTVGMASTQILLASLDWLLTGTVLFALLPPSDTLSYVELLRIYLIAQTVAVASHVPGGAGVFELVVLALRPVDAAATRVVLVAALLMFRFVYYLVPLVAATVVAAVAELTTRRAGRSPVVSVAR